MGLFDKKYCDNCGASLGLVIDCKLQDANICKECRNKLSPFFSGYKQTTLNEVKQQLAYREQNKARLSSFRPTLTIGDPSRTGNYKVFVDQNAGNFIVCRSTDFINTNPDLIPVSSVTACNVKVDESRDEVMQNTPDGRRISYNPPRYNYEYSFEVEILVNHQYFSKINFELTDSSHRPDNRYSEMYRFYENQANQLCMALTGRGWVSDNNGYSGKQNYNNNFGQQAGGFAGAAGAVINGIYNAQQNAAQQNMYNNGFNQQQTVYNNGMNNGYQQTVANNGYQTPVQNNAVNNAYQTPVQNNAAAGAWICSSCGQSNTGKFCSSCGAKMPVAGCPSCGWTPDEGAQKPRFCPNCGTQLG